MITRKATTKYVRIVTASLAAMLMLSAPPVSASNELPLPCLDLSAHADQSLRDMLDDDVTVPAIRTVDASKSVSLIETSSESADEGGSKTESPDDGNTRNTEVPDIATRLPGVSTTDLLRFRQQMFRTDI